MGILGDCGGIFMFAATISLAVPELYSSRDKTGIGFTKLEISPYSGIQECIEACNKEQYLAFGWKSRINSDQIDCYVNNGTGSVELEGTAEIWVKENQREKYKTCCEKLCPPYFVNLGNLTGCYYPALNEEVTWDDAQSACQLLNPQAHLITLDSEEVTPSGCHSCCNLTSRVCAIHSIHVYLSFRNAMSFQNTLLRIAYITSGQVGGTTMGQTNYLGQVSAVCPFHKGIVNSQPPLAIL